CEACRRRGRLDIHHVIKRAQGGSDFDQDRLVALCPPCHARTDAPYGRGRLVVTPCGHGAFRFELVWRAAKWDATGERRQSIGIPGKPYGPAADGAAGAPALDMTRRATAMASEGVPKAGGGSTADSRVGKGGLAQRWRPNL